MIAVLFALGSAGALAQNGAAPQPPTGKPVNDSASYGPVLNPQAPPATSGQPTRNGAQASGEARPQAQEERAGMPPVTGKPIDADPSARPAPESQPPQGQTPQAQPARPTQNQQPMTEQEKRGQPERKTQQKQAQRRPGAVQHIEATPRIVAPAPTLTPRAPAPGVAAPVAPSTSQVVGCVGSMCTDASGATYNASGNTAVSRDGRLCTRNGANMQCL
jgi:hypothetical protein